MQIGVTTVKNSLELPQKIKNGSALWSSDSTSRNISKETWNTNSKEYVHPYVDCSIIYNGQDLEAAQVSITKWVDKTTIGHLCKGILLSHEKEGNLTFCDSMDDLENIMLSGISLSEKDKYHVISLIWTKD